MGPLKMTMILGQPTRSTLAHRQRHSRPRAMQRRASSGKGSGGGLLLAGGGGGQDGPGRTPVFARACVRCVCLSSVLIYVNVLFVLFGHGMA